MRLQTLPPLLLLLLAPHRSFSQLPPTTKKPAFNILAIIPPETPLAHVSAWSLTIPSTSPISDTLPVLLTPDPNLGTTFYENGTSETFAARTSQILTDGVDDGVPWAITLRSPGQESSQIELVKGGQGYPGVQVAEWPATVYLETGTFFVCNVTTSSLSSAVAEDDEENVIALFWRRKGSRTPEGCSNAEMQAWCVEGGTLHENSRDSTCYYEEEE
ncbi:unnamed protein product [Periconia digitata]|uniref:DUF7907 domain-containing protein n=1 Tax=Periconia digitata TaxID=1303443 RepID=A0A9W4XHP9_9PLEO|nr:unnamed protein product [Periconia digitata]